ncbi:hypothetical protein K2O51_31590 (plasmid) [Cupriavidus pinatubonensis]|uniref:zinc ribbon domain-containing protein n=1 Tax=Cupriavidus pinatubonensis TaxID=248026 RepID=UPI001C7323C5|nr:zinc ribbon domain-containing protein [Cupriavidus pinatubonensis]QYY33573.1 hypothetical protein K2O51_31590 [Cupriavidus pinatubonensis]
MSEPYKLNKDQIRQIKLTLRDELAGASRQEAATLYSAYLKLLSQPEFSAGIASTTSGYLLMLLLDGIRIFNWMTIAGALVFLGLAFVNGAMMLWGTAIFVVQFLVLGKIQTEINLELIARGGHFIRHHAEQAATQVPTNEASNSSRPMPRYVCSLCQQPIDANSAVCPNCGVGIGPAR